jgi:DNA polymerase-3 subunit delta'
MSSIAGHKKIIEDLKILKERDSLPNGFIFSGHSMIGKKAVAFAFANFLESGSFSVPSQNLILQDTKLIDKNFSKLLKPDSSGDSIGIDASYEIKKFLFDRPNKSSRRVLIVDEAERMTSEAQNAILKIAEEPPLSSFIILISSDNEGLLPTISSRFQKITFSSVSEQEIIGWLISDFNVSKKDSTAVAKKSFGNPGIAWRLIFDEVFKKNILLAQRFIKSTDVNRKDIIKEIIQPEDFNMRDFLDVVILNLAWDDKIKNRAKKWHKALALYSQIANFSLNPRLQLENLLID